MKKFFDDSLLLGSGAAANIYSRIKDLPIIDYHCHLDQFRIRDNASFSDIGELWLSGDHYKWRAMRLCGVDEEYITGRADYHEKFIKYAEILPMLAGNPLYYWTHMELRQIFGIEEPLNSESAERIYSAANEKLKDISVRSLLKQYKVEYIATTDNPCDTLEAHGKYGDTTVVPTFRPDKLLAFDSAELNRLEELVGYRVDTLPLFLKAIESRLQFFVQKGCRISDHGFLKFPSVPYVDRERAEELYLRRASLGNEQKEALFGYLLTELAKLYKKYSVIMQLHFAVTRNVNPQMFLRCGVDAGFDVIAKSSDIEDVITFFAQLSDEERPETVLYTLNDSALSSLACVCGAFRHVRLGAAWWFNDTLLGIRRNLQTIAEYSAIGTNLGMLTDSRSFSSYSRFDFFRRILADYLGELVEKGEFEQAGAVRLAENICYYNIKKELRI